MDLTPTTYTAPSSLASSPVAPIYDAWHALAGDFLGLAPTIRALPLDLLATSLGVPVWRTAWPDGVKEQVIAWYGQYGGRLYTRAGLAAFVWIFGGDLTTWGAITDYWETDPAGTVGTTAATPSSPMAYTDDVISSYIAEWVPLGRTLTLDSSAAVIGRTRTIRRIIVTIPSGNPTLVPLGTNVAVRFSGSGAYYVFELLSLDPTDDSTIFTGIIDVDRNNAPVESISLSGISPSIATAVMDESIPDGILQYGYHDVVTGSPVLTSGRPGWDAVVVTTRAVLSIEVYNSMDDAGANEFYRSLSPIWTATYASGDVIKFYANPDNESVPMRTVGGGVYGFTLRFVALSGGPLANEAFVSFTPDEPGTPGSYDGMPIPVIKDIIAYGDAYTYPAIPAIPALGTPVPLPPFATVAPVVLTDSAYYKAELAKMPSIACGQVYIDGDAVTIRPMLAPDYRVGDAATAAAIEFRFNVLGLARGAHVITCKNLNAANKTVSLSVTLTGVSVEEFEAFATTVARAYVSALGASACDAEGSYVTLDASSLAAEIAVAYGDDSVVDVYATSSPIRYPAASISVVYTSDGYTYVPNGLAVDNGVGVILAFTYL